MANSNDAKSVNKGGGSFLYVLVLIAIAVGILATFVRREPPAAAPQFVGLPLPPLHVEGWLNTAGPLRDEDLRGKVVLIDCWFVDCPPCRAAMPHLVQFHRQHRDPNFVLLGLTPDSGQDAARAAAFVESIEGLDWPIGVGAGVPLDMLGISAFPTLILFNKSGVSVWAGHDTTGLEIAVATALAERGS